MSRPTAPGAWIATAKNAAIAHINWKRVSNVANARPWFAFGASRCTMLSNPSRPSAATKLTTHASAIPATGEPKAARPMPAAALTINAACSIVSSRSFERTFEASALPAIVASADAPTAAPNRAVPLSKVRNQKARWKKVKPTFARSTVMAIAPARSDGDRSSNRSSSPAADAATTSGASRRAEKNASTKRKAP